MIKHIAPVLIGLFIFSFAMPIGFFVFRYINHRKSFLSYLSKYGFISLPRSLLAASVAIALLFAPIDAENNAVYLSMFILLFTAWVVNSLLDAISAFSNARE